MNKTNVKVASAKGMSKLEKAVFWPGALLQHEDLNAMTAYTQELSRLMFRSLFGCGVICGLKVGTKWDCGEVYVTVEAGLGLDCSGYPIYVPKNQEFVLDDKFDVSRHNQLWVVLCGTVMQCAPRTTFCSSDDDEATAVSTRERDGFEIRVVSGDEPPKCVCRCPDPEDGKKGYEQEFKTDCKCVNPDHPCYKDHYDGKCGCHCDDCSDCDCRCVLLARLVWPDKNSKEEGPILWTVDYSVRRFIRPVLMRDPEVEAPTGLTGVPEGQALSQKKSAQKKATAKPKTKAKRSAKTKKEV